jgi:hypothetical protein
MAEYSVCRDTPYSTANAAFFSPACTRCRSSLTCSAVNERFLPLYTAGRAMPGMGKELNRTSLMGPLAK